MKKSIVLMAVAAMTFAASCIKDNSVQTEALGTKTFSANTEPSVKTGFEGTEKKVYWTSGDAISVFPITAGEVGASTDFPASNIDGSTADFTGAINDADRYFAVYPADAGITFDGTTLTTAIPEVQEAVPGGFDTDLNLMAAMTDEGGDHFSFQNLCSLFKITIPDNGGDYDKIKSITIRSNYALTGAYSYNFADNDLAAGEPVSSTADCGTVTLCHENGDCIAPGTYYLVVSPSGKGAKPQTFYINIKLADGRTNVAVSSSVKQIYMHKNTIYNLGTLALNDEGYLLIDPYDAVKFWDAQNSSETTMDGIMYISSGSYHIEHTKQWTKLAFEYVAPKTGTYTPYVLYGNKTDDVYLYVDTALKSSQADLSSWFNRKGLNSTLVCSNGPLTNTGNFGSKEKKSLNSSSFTQGETYYLNLVFYHSEKGKTDICNVHEFGFDVTE